jgi:tetratricopeptide (TPR) repeat protein
MLTDAQANPLPGATEASAAAYAAALADLAGFRSSVLAHAEAAAAEPGFPMGQLLAGTLAALSNEPATLSDLHRALDALAGMEGHLSPREAQHRAALEAWLEGDIPEAGRQWQALSRAYPRDLLALIAGHQSDFFTGNRVALEARIREALPHWPEGTPQRGALFGMLAFGLEEQDRYEEALEAAEAALAQDRRDAWAVHAIAHVHEMRGERGAGIAWLTSRAPDWQQGDMLAYHNWWHLALFLIAEEDFAAATAVYDQNLAQGPGATALELVDAAALLWRLKLAGADVGDRFANVADAWDMILDAPGGVGHYVFNDFHASLARVGAGRLEGAEVHIAALEARARKPGARARLTADVGLPLVRAVYALGRGARAEAADLLALTIPKAIAFGGSNAQRDILRQTLEAAQAA